MKANPLLAQLGLPLDERGRVKVDATLRVEGTDDVWALGDCARVPNLAAADPDPPTSQHALRQARRLAKNLSGDPQPYRYRMLGQVATLGRYKGIADVLGLRLRGFPGWFVTRTYHLYPAPAGLRKLRVVTDWTTSLFFRRDIAELGTSAIREGLREVGLSRDSAYARRGSSCGLRRTTSSWRSASSRSAGIHPPEEMPFGVAWTDDVTVESFVGSTRQHSPPGAPDDWTLNLVTFLEALRSGRRA